MIVIKKIISNLLVYFLLLFLITTVNFYQQINDSNIVLRSNIYLHSFACFAGFCCLSRLLISILGFNTRTLMYVARSII